MSLLVSHKVQQNYYYIHIEE